MAVIKLDNQTVAQTNWRPCSQQAWDQRSVNFLFRLLVSFSRYFFISFHSWLFEIQVFYWSGQVQRTGGGHILAWLALLMCYQVSTSWRIYRWHQTWNGPSIGASRSSFCRGLLSLNLDVAINWTLVNFNHGTFCHFAFLQIKFLNPMISRKPKLQRQRKIFKQQVKNFPRATQMNINVATWGRLLKRSSPSIQNNNSHGNSRSASESPPSGRSIRQLKLGENGNRHYNGHFFPISIC